MKIWLGTDYRRVYENSKEIGCFRQSDYKMTSNEKKWWWVGAGFCEINAKPAATEVEV